MRFVRLRFTLIFVHTFQAFTQSRASERIPLDKEIIVSSWQADPWAMLHRGRGGKREPAKSDTYTLVVQGIVIQLNEGQCCVITLQIVVFCSSNRNSI